MILGKIICPPIGPPYYKINTNTRLLGHFLGHLDENSLRPSPSSTLHILPWKIYKYLVKKPGNIFNKCIV